MIRCQHVNIHIPGSILSAEICRKAVGVQHWTSDHLIKMARSLKNVLTPQLNIGCVSLILDRRWRNGITKNPDADDNRLQRSESPESSPYKEGLNIGGKARWRILVRKVQMPVSDFILTTFWKFCHQNQMGCPDGKNCDCRL